MNTKKTVGDLRAFAQERGIKLPEEFEVKFPTIKTVFNDGSDCDVLVWVEYRE